MEWSLRVKGKTVGKFRSLKEAVSFYVFNLWAEKVTVYRGRSWYCCYHAN